MKALKHHRSLAFVEAKLQNISYKMKALEHNSGSAFTEVKFQDVSEQKICHTPFWEDETKASIRVPRMFKSHV
jgi:hypothetical protein